MITNPTFLIPLTLQTFYILIIISVRNVKGLRQQISKIMDLEKKILVTIAHLLFRNFSLNSEQTHISLLRSMVQESETTFI